MKVAKNRLIFSQINPRINNKLRIQSNLRNHSNNVIQAAELNWIELTALTRSLQNKNQKKNLGFADTGAFCHEIRAGNIPA